MVKITIETTQGDNYILQVETTDTVQRFRVYKKKITEWTEMRDHQHLIFVNKSEKYKIIRSTYLPNYHLKEGTSVKSCAKKRRISTY
jgi:hypothetical protein